MPLDRISSSGLTARIGLPELPHILPLPEPLADATIKAVVIYFWILRVDQLGQRT